MEEDTHEAMDKVPKEKKEYSNMMRENPWMVSTFVIGFLVVLLLAGSVFPNITGSTVSGSEAGDAVLDFANAQGANAELVDVISEGSFYKVTLSIEGNEVPVYVTKDGKYFTSSLIPLVAEEETTPNSNTQTQEIPKSEKPSVELYVWSYCPYGVQAQGPLVEVASLLKDKVDFEVVLYYDGHGPYETQQNKIQGCIQKLAKDKYWDYADGFVNDIYPKCGSSRDINCDKTESIKVMKSLGIDSTKVMSCVSSDGEALISEYSERAKTNGVTGSPSLLINGFKTSSARTSEAFKAAICSAFNIVPSECDVTLESSTSAASGNC